MATCRDASGAVATRKKGLGTIPAVVRHARQGDSIPVMQWKFVLSRAGAEARGLSDQDIASLFDMALASAQPAGAGPCCPRCGNDPDDSDSKLFREESADTPEQVKGRVVVMCLCKIAYWYDAVHKIDARQPIGEAVVRAASAPRPVTPPQPPAGRFVTDGGVPQRTYYTPDAASRVFPPVQSELLPGTGNTLDAATQVVLITYEHRRRFHAATSFITPPFGPVRARDPLP